MGMSVLSLPASLWHLYVKHLWNYKPGSWVDSTASTFRLLAFAVVAPFVLLTLLDVASYVIARTLGVIDQTKASTSSADVLLEDTPTIVIQDESSSTPPSDASTPTLTSAPPADEEDEEEEEEEGNLELAGVGMFSPGPSQPPSPTLSRRHACYCPLPDDSSSGAATPRDAPGSAGSSSSGASSFAILDRDSGSEDAGVLLRRRARPGTEAEEEAADADAESASGS